MTEDFFRASLGWEQRYFTSQATYGAMGSLSSVTWDHRLRIITLENMYPASTGMLFRPPHEAVHELRQMLHPTLG
jgi:hypothetical protein